MEYVVNSGWKSSRINKIEHDTIIYKTLYNALIVSKSKIVSFIMRLYCDIFTPIYEYMDNCNAIS